MQSIVALLFFAFCNIATVVQARRCLGVYVSIWDFKACVGYSRTARPLNLLADVANKIEEGSRQNVANLNIGDIDLGEKGSIKDVNIQNLETFEVAKVELGNIQPLELKNLQINIDLLIVDGTYDVTNLNVPLVGNISGNGNFRIDLSNVNISAALTFKFQDLNKIVVDDITDIKIDLKAGFAVLEGVEGGDAVNNALSAIIPDAVREVVPQHLEKNKQVLINFFNEILN